MKKAFVLSIVVWGFTSHYVTADTFGTGGNEFVIDFVTISGSTNPSAGISTGGGFTFTGVGNDYRMGICEVTNDQWNKFVNSYGAVTGSPSDAYDETAYFTGLNAPANGVSWCEAAQFVNWLNVSSGYQAAYKFTGTQGQSDYSFSVWDATDTGYDASNLYRNSNAHYFLPTENEWVKAAYWNGTALQTYSTVDNSFPLYNVDAHWEYDGPPDELWDVSCCTEELNGTYDMTGNIAEFLESAFDGSFAFDAGRGLRGSSSHRPESSVNRLSSSYRSGISPYAEYEHYGFRVASVPEPATLALLALGGLALRKCF